MVVDAMIRAAAVGGVAMVWSYLTLKSARLWGDFTNKTFKICKQIVFPPEPRKNIRVCIALFPSRAILYLTGVA